LSQANENSLRYIKEEPAPGEGGEETTLNHRKNANLNLLIKDIMEERQELNQNDDLDVISMSET